VKNLIGMERRRTKEREKLLPASKIKIDLQVKTWQGQKTRRKDTWPTRGEGLGKEKKKERIRLGVEP